MLTNSQTCIGDTCAVYVLSGTFVTYSLIFRFLSHYGFATEEILCLIFLNILFQLPSPPPPPDLVSSGDSLHDAVMDFEQVLKRTMEVEYKGRINPIRPNFISSIDLLNNTNNAATASPFDIGSSPDKSPLFSPSAFVSPKYIQSQAASSPLVSTLLSSKSRSGSTSSLDSQSTVSTVSNFGVQVNLLPEVCLLAFHN